MARSFSEAFAKARKEAAERSATVLKKGGPGSGSEHTGGRVSTGAAKTNSMEQSAKQKRSSNVLAAKRDVSQPNITRAKPCRKHASRNPRDANGAVGQLAKSDVGTNTRDAREPSGPIEMTPTARFALVFQSVNAIPASPSIERAGTKTQICRDIPDDERDLVLGIDFGTSTVKVIIGDSALGKSFAVPFVSSATIGKYLMPCHLYQSNDLFSLNGGDVCHRDLKLSFLATPGDSACTQRVVAFLALVIRRARGWLLTKQAGVYAHSRLFWKLAVGFPAAHYQQEKTLLKQFEQLCQTAWRVANDGGAVNEKLISATLDSLGYAKSVELSESDAEIAVLPEIAAQIYGFVVSTSFDPEADNVYLMADVGAGTLDASLFRVFPAHGGRWDFEFYTSIVEPNGVMNLHRHRIAWWAHELTKVHTGAPLLQALEETKFVTDQQMLLPESYRDYFSGVNIVTTDQSADPDHGFHKRVMQQVQGRAYWRAAKDGLLTKDSLREIPFFLCGGGARLGFYSSLKADLAHIRGYSWLKVKARSLVAPDDLLVENIDLQDYDRLSVAYGLSRLKVGKIEKALPHYTLENDFGTPNWRENYIDKDMC